MAAELEPSMMARSVQVVSISWAFSSWTKASLLLQPTQPLPFRNMGEDDKRYFACYHLLMAWTILRHLRAVQKSTQAPLLTMLTPIAGSSMTLIRHVPLLTVLTILFDELAYYFIYVMMFGRKTTAVGKAVRRAANQDEDCIICRGAGIDNFPLASLEYYCNSPQHVAHRHCMQVWVASRQKNAYRCPSCRSILKIRSDFSIRSVVNIWDEINWGSVFNRALITGLFVVLSSLIGQLNSHRQRPQKKL